MKSIRVFISSAFLDMQAERNHLNRIVFPELRSRCRRRGADFVGIDLRWGLTEDETRQGGALAACLQEIDRCRPFFLSLLGDRYGWIPPPVTIPRALFDERLNHNLTEADAKLLVLSYELDEVSEPPVFRLRRDRRLTDDEAKQLASCGDALGLDNAGESITSQEILHGAFSHPRIDTPSIFYLRKSGITADPDFPRTHASFFLEPEQSSRHRLEQLKERIRQAAKPALIIRDYEVQFAGWRIEPTLLRKNLPDADRDAIRSALKDGIIQPQELKLLSGAAREFIECRGTIALSGLEDFGRRMVEDLWDVVQPFLKAEENAPHPGKVETGEHGDLLEQAPLFFGRDEILNRMFSYAADKNGQPLVITGRPGSGKSALMMEFARRYRANDSEDLVLPYFVGSAPGSTDITFAVRSLCEQLCHECGLEDAVAADPDKLQHQFLALLAKAGARRRIILLIDALDQLDPAHNSHELSWLPFAAPPGVRILVSALPGDCLDTIKRGLEVDNTPVEFNPIIEVPELPRDKRRELISEQLLRRGKKLTEDQMTRLLDTDRRPEAGLPLYLLVAIEELCLFGDRTALDQRLDRLPKTLAALFDQVLERLEHDHTFEITEAILRWLAVTRSGLLESEIIGLLRRYVAGASMVDWLQFYRALEFYLRPLNETTRSGFVAFYHDQLRVAVCKRYLRMKSHTARSSSEVRATHNQLADFFRSLAQADHTMSGWRTDQVHSLSELPFHLFQAGQVAALRMLLLDFNWMQAKLDALDYPALVVDYDLLPRVKALRLVQASIRLSAATLLQDKAQLAGQLLGRLLNEGSRDIQALLKQAKRWRARSWLRPVRNSLQRPGPCLYTLIGHTSTVNGVAVTGDGHKVVSASSDFTLKIWDLATGRGLRILEGHQASVTSVAVNPRRPQAVSASADKTLKLWNLETGRLQRTLSGHAAEVLTVAITEDGNLAVSGAADGTIKVWDLETGKILRELIGHEDKVTSVAVAPDGGRVVSGSTDNTVRIWDLTSGSLLHTLQNRTFPSLAVAVAVTPDGRRMLSTSIDHLRVWDLETGRPLGPGYRHKGFVTNVAIVPARPEAITTSMDQTLRVWDLSPRDTGKPLRTFSGHAERIDAVAVTGDGRHAVSGSRDDTVRVWDLESTDQREQSDGWIYNLYKVAALANSRQAVTVGAMFLNLWDLRTATSLRRLYSETRVGIDKSAISPSGRLALVVPLKSNEIWVVDLKRRTVLHTLPGHADQINDMAIFPGERKAISASSDATLRVWDLEHGAELHTLRGHTSGVRAVAVTPDQQRAISTSNDRTLRVWDTNTGEHLDTLPLDEDIVTHLAVCAGNRILASTSDHALLLLDMATGAPLRTLAGHSEKINAIAVLDDTPLAVSASDDRTVRVWDVERGTGMVSFTTDNGLESCAITPDGRTIIACGLAGQFHVLRLITVR